MIEMGKAEFINFLLDAYNTLLQPIPNPMSPFSEFDMNLPETVYPMAASEITDYRSLIERMERYPNSLRLFNDLHQASLNILKERGVMMPGFFSVKRGYYQLNRPENGLVQETNALAIIYRKTFLGDRLNIVDSSYAHSKESVLYRLRGYETVSMLEKGEVSEILNEPLYQIARSLFTKFQPSCLELNNGMPEEKKVIQF